MVTGRFRVIRFVACLAVVSAGMTVSAAVVGNLNTGSAGTVTFSLGGITFDADPSSTPAGPPWSAEVANTTTLAFTGGPLAVTEAIQIFSPVTTTTVLPVTSYLTFAAHPLLVFSLTSIGPGSPSTNCFAATTIGASCSLFAGSPLVLTRVSNGTAISFAVAGKASDTSTAGLAAGSNYVGVFTAMVTGQTPGEILLFFCPTGTCVSGDFTSGKTLTASQSGRFVAATAP